MISSIEKIFARLQNVRQPTRLSSTNDCQQLIALDPPSKVKFHMSNNRYGAIRGPKSHTLNVLS